MTSGTYACDDQPLTNPSRLISPRVVEPTISDTMSMPISSTPTPTSSRYFIMPAMPTMSGEVLGSSVTLDVNIGIDLTLVNLLPL